MANSKGKLIGIGTPGNHVVAPFLVQELRKSERSTGVRTGIVIAVDVTANVGNFRKGTARFAKQFIVDIVNDQKLLMVD